MYQFFSSGEVVYNQLHHDEAHGHTGEEVRYKTGQQHDDEMVFSPDFSQHKGRPVEVDHHQSVHDYSREHSKRTGAVMDHYEEIQVEAKGKAMFSKPYMNSRLETCKFVYAKQISNM